MKSKKGQYVRALKELLEEFLLCKDYGRVEREKILCLYAQKQD